MSCLMEHFNYLHTIPERGMEEVKTSAYLADCLEKAGYAVERHVGGKTGVVGVWDSGVPGPVLGLRADMDALTHVIDGVRCARHTCGHDGHSSMVLTAAEEAKEQGLVKKGKLKILFQPAEELSTGAPSMIEGGAIDDIDILIGAHIQPAANVPTGCITPAMYHSAQYMMTARFHGVQAHGSRPHLGVNAIEAGALAVQGVSMVHIDPNLSFSVKPTRFVCDNGALNAIPPEAVVSWDMRCEENQAMEDMKEKTMRAIRAAADAVGAEVELSSDGGVPAAEYSEEAVRLISEAVTDVLGADRLYRPIRLTGGEDFHYYIRHKPSLKAGYFGLGCDAYPGLHHPDMHFKTEYLEDGKNVFVDIVKKVLG